MLLDGESSCSDDPQLEPDMITLTTGYTTTPPPPPFPPYGASAQCGPEPPHFEVSRSHTTPHHSR